jgi:hypothetical protein
MTFGVGGNLFRDGVTGSERSGSTAALMGHRDCLLSLAKIPACSVSAVTARIRLFTIPAEVPT